MIWIGVVVAAALLIELLILYPNRVNLAGRQADFKGFVASMRTDILGCQAALNDGYAALARIHQGDVKQLNNAKTIISQDEAYCTLAVNSDLYNLATLSPPNDLNRYDLTPVTKNLYAWAYPGAAGILADSEKLLVDPASRSALADIRTRIKNMNYLLNLVNNDLSKVSSQLKLAPQTVSLDPTGKMPLFLRSEV